MSFVVMCRTELLYSMCIVIGGSITRAGQNIHVDNSKVTFRRINSLFISQNNYMRCSVCMYYNTHTYTYLHLHIYIRKN